MATAAAESGRNPFIYNTYKLGHFGLFQISRSAHGDFFAPGGNGMDWVNPAENARKGYQIYRSQGWGAWEAHTKGLHLVHLPQARAAVAAFDNKAAGRAGEAYWQSLFRPKTREYIFAAAVAGNPGALSDAVGSAIAPGVAAGAEATGDAVVDSGAAVAASVGDLAKVMTGAWQALTTPAVWMRVGYGALGVVLVAGGLFLIVRDRPAVKAVAAKAASVVPGGAVLKGTS